jgi:hypothetical protein
LEAAQSEDGIVMPSFTHGGYAVQVNGKNLVDTEDPRLEATWRAAVDSLELNGMIEDLGGKGEVLFMRKPGYDMADMLKAAAESQKAEPDVTMSDTDLVNKIHEWFGKQGFKGGTQTVTFADIDRKLKIPAGSAKRLLDKAMADYNYFPVLDSIGEQSMRIRFVAPASSAPSIVNPK